MIKTRTWVAGILLVLAVCLSAALWLWSRPAAGTVANIYQDGVCIRSVDLSLITEPEQWVVETDTGSNVIEIQPGKIRILEADCPDQICVEAGWLTDSAAPIVCLPHRLVIRLEQTAERPETQGGIDAVSQ